jgi:AraC family transcriptional regulator of adaptative response / DNA-3-methyladenine glycosylase II
MLSANICQQARLSRDSRFDGKFFTAVLTTGIFCRPTCPARAPKEENVRYYENAMQAQIAGYQPCKRCLPELAPATKLPISAGQLIRATEQCSNNTELSQQLSLSDRQIRRLFQQHFGLSPSLYFQQQKLLLARKLLTTSTLSITDIAFAAGFKSIRRFNEAIKKQYQATPSQIRQFNKRANSNDNEIVNTQQGQPVQIRLSYRPPFDWPLMLSFIKQRQIPSIERITDSSYSRTITIDNITGWLHVEHHKSKLELCLTVKLSDYRVINQVIKNVRRMFDLDADMQVIHQHLQQNKQLATVIEHVPGMRLPGCWDLFEFSIRAILGQQISVKAATTLANRISEKYGEKAPENPWQIAVQFPTPKLLKNVDYADIGLTKTRIQTLQNWVNYYIAAQLSDHNIFKNYAQVEQLEQALISIKGIGPWTANYLAMRGLSDPDAFPSADLGIIKALKSTSQNKPNNKEILTMAEQWRPWRSYAALYLWHSLSLNPN